MRVVITGSSGFVGRYLVGWLAARGHSGIAVSRKPPAAAAPPGWRWRDRESALNMTDRPEQFDCMVHLEVKQHVDSPSAADVAEFQEVNVEGTRRWLAWCSRTGVRRIIYFSSIKAVGDSDLEQDETIDSAPTTAYGLSKRAAEALVEQWARDDQSRIAVILRPAVIYGPGSLANVYSMMRAIDRGHFILVGGGRAIKSLVSLQNVAAAVEHAMRLNVAGCEIYNVVDRQSRPLQETARLLAKHLGKRMWFPSLPLSIAQAAAAVGAVAGRSLGKKFPLTKSRLTALTQTTHFSPAKLVASGFKHPQSEEDGLREMVEWYCKSKTLGEQRDRPS